MYRSRRIAVVVPAYNEERLIGRTVAGIPPFVDRIIVVDDASQDATALRAREADLCRTEIVRHDVNRGVGAAIASGYRAALAARDGEGPPPADIVVVMAGDDQMDPADLPALCDPLVEDRADYVKGNRMRHPDVLRTMPLWRFAGGLALSVSTRWLTGYPGLSDSQCGYTAISRRALLALPLDELYPRYGYPNDLLGLCAAAGLRVAEVVVRPRYGDETSGITPLTALPLLRVLTRVAARRLWTAR